MGQKNNMKNKHHSLVKTHIFTHLLFSLGVVLSLFTPVYSYAASMKASSGSTIRAGDTSVIEVYVDTEGQQINSVEGSIILSDEHQGNFQIQDISLAQSSFTLWPRKPSLESNHTISFVGGVPGGVIGDRILLFKVIVKINAPGAFTISPNNMQAYLHDGLGTALPIPVKNSVITVGEADTSPQNKWEEIVSNDNQAPNPFVVELIQDANLFEGKKFISFETTDGESGISHYEVREGTYPSVRTGTTYVLIDQKSHQDIIVTAYDKAGNFQVAVLSQKDSINWKSIIIVVLGIVLVRMIIKKILRKRHKKIHVQ